MKNALISSMVVALTLACVLSCDDQSEKLETKNEHSLTSMNVNNGRISSSGYVAFDGTEGDAIDLTTANEWAANFKNAKEDSDEIVAHYFGFEIIQQILKQPGCVGIRIYYALDNAGEKKLLLIGVDEKGQNMLPNPGGKTTGEGNVVADFSYPCPSYCPGNGIGDI